MGDLKRWSVTYTKHVKQKRKIYQDGYLELQHSGNKVMLYDEYDKILESRFVKKDDVIKSGESLTFDSYLVDIGDQCGRNESFSSLNCQDNDKKVKENLSSSCDYEYKKNSERKPSSVESKAQVIKLSPSQRIIREFKKRELHKYNSSSSPSFLDMTKSTEREWQVLYTTQLTQKAKKFHDGFLRLVVRGSQGRQVMLYDTTRQLLNSRFLKKNEIVTSGGSLAFEGHLVDIGELEGDHKLPIDLTPPTKIHKKTVGKRIFDIQAESAVHESCVGQPQYDTSHGEHFDHGGSTCKVVNTKLGWKTPTNEPKRAAHEILSILRKPKIQEKLVAQNKYLLGERFSSHSSDVHSNINCHINVFAQNRNEIAEDKVREEVLDDDFGVSVLECEDVQILDDVENCSVSEIGRGYRSSTFGPRFGVINHALLTHHVEESEECELGSTSSAVEPQILVTPTLDSFGQTPPAPGSVVKSNKNVELEDPFQISLCKEHATGASRNDLSSNILPKFCEESKDTGSIGHEGVCSFGIADSSNDASQNPSGDEAQKQEFNRKETMELPSFDLGF